MFEKLEILNLAQGLASHAASRQTVVAQNVANADTPGFRQREIKPFTEVWRQGPSQGELRRTREQHLHGTVSRQLQQEFVVGNASVEPNGNSVSLETEIMKSAEIRQEHDLALSIYRTSIGLLRTSLGRR